MENEMKKNDHLKLDFVRTLKVGCAFLGIMMFWEVYDFIMPLILANYFGLTSFEYGLVMGLDNLLAIFLLPFFGSLSDKAVNAKLGRRTTFIFWGSILAAASVIFLMIMEAKQFSAIASTEIIALQNLGLEDVPFSELTLEVQAKVLDLVNALVSKGFIATNWTVDITASSDVAVSIIAIQTEAARHVTSEQPVVLVLFIVALLFILVSMASYRSPAIALMPDVTPKPLRSQANALITLMGGAGGLIAIIIYKIFGSQRYEQHYGLWAVTAGALLLILGAYLLLVKERKFIGLRAEEEQKYNIIDEEEEEEKHGMQKLPKEKFISLLLILGTVFLWFMGYNCVKSHLSVYATQYLNISQSTVGTINIFNGVGGAVALLPCAFLANKIGRKKTIFAGLGIAAVAFIPSFFMTKNTPGVDILFPICFILSGFGMVFVNVNTLPMVTELSKGSNVGKYTGYYYVASMTAQAITPSIAGVVMDNIAKNWLFVYSIVFIALATITTILIKHGDSKAEKKQSVSEYFDDAD